MVDKTDKSKILLSLSEEESKQIGDECREADCEYRLSAPFGGQIKDIQDRHFPATNQLNYNNYLVAINKINGNQRYQFILSNSGSCKTQDEDFNNWRRYDFLTPKTQVCLIQLGYEISSKRLVGFKFFNKEGHILF